VEQWESGRRRPDKLVRLLLKNVETNLNRGCVEGGLMNGPGIMSCGVVGYPEGKRRRCELFPGHNGYHQQGRVRWLGHWRKDGLPVSVFGDVKLTGNRRRRNLL
jgi:hypothetical protein